MAKQKRKPRIGLVSFDISHGLPYQRLHIPFRKLQDEFDIRCFDLENFRDADAFYLDAIVFSHPWTERSLRIIEQGRFHYSIPVLVDIDDLVSEMPADHPNFLEFRPQKLNHIVQAASHVVYSTKYLATRLGHMNARHTVIPNAIDADMWKKVAPSHKPHKNAFIIGWTGGQSHRPDQYEFVDAVDKFLSTHPDAKAYFHVLCPDRLLRKFGAQVIYDPMPCAHLDYPAVASAYPFDVCLVGLQDTPFNHAKSDLKLLEMAPLGIPLIASPRSDFIQHQGRDIMLYADDAATNHHDWYEQLCFAYDNQDAMRAMGQRAKEYVMKERTSETAAHQWEKVLKDVLAK